MVIIKRPLSQPRIPEQFRARYFRIIEISTRTVHIPFSYDGPDFEAPFQERKQQALQFSGSTERTPRLPGPKVFDRRQEVGISNLILRQSQEGAKGPGESIRGWSSPDSGTTDCTLRVNMGRVEQRGIQMRELLLTSIVPTAFVHNVM